MASELARKKALSTCDRHRNDGLYTQGTVCPQCEVIAAALDEARREGAERERWECYRIASDFSDRIGGSAGAVAIRLADRGAMRGPEEE